MYSSNDSACTIGPEIALTFQRPRWKKKKNNLVNLEEKKTPALSAPFNLLEYTFIFNKILKI